MFYSETLLSKTGPLARVWLSANLERKLSKTHILQSNIESSVGAIVAQDQAPMALRLSGQLLLGVVRIYSRKARYLLEDCNEALMKIKMAFRPGNVDLPAGATAHTTAQLTLPDVITELDLLLPDPTLDLGDLGELPFDSEAHVSRRQDISLEDSQFLQESIEQARGVAPGGEEELLEMEEDLGIDIGEEISAPTPRPGRATTVARAPSVDLLSEAPSFEIGRRAPSVEFGEDLLSETRMEGLELEGERSPKLPEAEQPLILEEEDLGLGLEEGVGFEGELGFGEETLLPPEEAPPVPGAEPSPAAEEAVGAPTPGFLLERSESPLSTVPSERAASPTRGAQLDVTFVDHPSEEPEEGEAQAARGRKRKVMIDAQTQIKSKQFKAQQEDRSRILTEPSFLPRDPGVLALMSLTRTGALAHSVFYPKHIAPELANLLAPEFVKRMADLKRKREAAERGEEAEEAAPSPAKQPKLVLLEEDEEALPAFEEEEAEVSRRGEMIELPPGEEERLPSEEYALPPAIEGSPSPQPEIVPTTPGRMSPSPPPAPVVVSRETRHTVHVLREQFSGPGAKESVVFQQLLPPASTTKGDATKMFFEVLVLATKDAVQVEQPAKELFGDISIRAKKELWGSWAEERDEQQVAEEEGERREKDAHGVEMVVGMERGRTTRGAAAAAAAREMGTAAA